MLVDGREERSPRDELGQDAAKGPHVDGLVVRESEHDFRTAIESALDVNEATFKLCARGSEVNNLHLFSSGVRKQYIFRLEVAMNNFYFRKVQQSMKHLSCDLAQ